MLFLIAGWLALSPFQVLRYMSTGTLWTNLPGSVVMALMHALSPAVLGVWMSILGRRLWSPASGLRTTLLWTHGILLVLGSLAVAVGIHAVEATELSTARGGGLLSPIAYFPLLFGVPVVILASFSLVVALVALPRYRSRGHLLEDSPPLSPVVSRKKVWLLLAILIVLAGVISVLLWSIWPTAYHQEAPPPKELTPARMRSDIDALRENLKKPPRDASAFLRSMIMNGRLGVMKLADQDATLTLVASNIPVAFECIDILEIERNKVMAQIEKKNGPQTMSDGRLEDEHLNLLNKMNDLLTVLKDIQRVPAGLEPFLAQRASRIGIARSVAVSLIGKLDIPADKRSWLLLSYVTHGDEEVAIAALDAVAEMGAQAEPVVDELKRIGLEYWKNPATAALSRSVNQTAEVIEKQVKHEASEKR